MPYSVKWYLEPYILHNQLFGEVTAEDIFHLDQQTLTHLETHAHLIHILHDDSQIIGTPPLNLATFRDMVHALRHSRLGWMMMLGESGATSRFFSAVIAQLFGFKMKRVASIELALAFLQEQDPELALLLANQQKTGGA